MYHWTLAASIQLIAYVIFGCGALAFALKNAKARCCLCRELYLWKIFGGDICPACRKCEEHYGCI